ncbi:unnamed protein product [Gadus morhua 'NCC']
MLHHLLSAAEPETSITGSGEGMARGRAWLQKHQGGSGGRSARVEEQPEVKNTTAESLKTGSLKEERQ